MILRQWRGLAKREEEAAYLVHFRDEILPQLRRLAGFKGARVLRRPTREGIEVIVLTRWLSMEAIRAFAGETVDAAVVAEAARPCFHRYDQTVMHHEIALDEES